MDKTDVIKRIGDEWLSFVIRGRTANETLATVEALIEGGAKVVEVTFTTPNVCRVLQALTDRYNDDIVLVAGTVRAPEQVRMAIDHGAQVIVSPNLYGPVVEAAQDAGKVSVPGCLTPTEIADAWRMGADIVKLFPCSGPQHVRELLAPFPEIRIMPAGGMALDRLAPYHQSGAFALVVGANGLNVSDAVHSGRYAEVTSTVRQWLESARVLRMQAPPL